MKVICITGIDGAGKSTVVNALSDRLESEDKSVSRIYGRYVDTLLRPPMYFARKLYFGENVGDDSDDSTRMERKKNVLSSGTSRSLYEALLLFDYTLYIWSKYLLNLDADYVIFDRYVFDTVLKHLSRHMAYMTAELSRKYESYVRFFPEPDHVFFLTISIETALQRKDDIPSREYIEEQKDLYDTFFDRLDGATYLDGEEPVDDIIDTIMGEIDD